MSEIGDTLRAMAAKTRVSSVNFSTSNPVGWSTDLERILALRRRTAAPSATLAATWTAALRRPEGQMNLRPIQALALSEAAEVGGLLAPIGVGEGKTLICSLLPTVMKARTAVLLIQPQLRDQFIQRMHPEYAKHWRVPNLAVSGAAFYPDIEGVLHVLSYSSLSSARGHDSLERIHPDLVICDEAHNVRHTTAARTKRFLRYFKAHPDTKLCALSGTLISKSIRDFAHLGRYSLGQGAPVPLTYPTLMEWAAALDPGEFRAPAGELEKLCERGEDVRSGFRRRVVQSPGVVASAENELGISLVMAERKLDCPPELVKALAQMRSTWCTPGGEEITDALTFSRYARQLAAGMYYRWIWPNQEPLALRQEWMERRREWHREVRTFLTGPSVRQGMDSPLLLARAASTGSWASQHWEAWSEIKDLAKPQTEAVWVSEFMAQDAVAWGTMNTGIIWFEHEALGQRIAELGGFPFFGGGDRASREILNESGTRTIVASRKAHGEGKNLQAWSTQLVTTPSSNGKTWEQLLGREHREGQTADEVTCNVYLHTPEMKKALNDAIADAHFIQDTLGTKQRLTYCSYAFAV